MIKVILALGAMIVASLGGATLVLGQDSTENTRGARIAAGDGVVDHVVVVSIDALNPDALRQLGPAAVRSTDRLVGR